MGRAVFIRSGSALVCISLMGYADCCGVSPGFAKRSGFARRVKSTSAGLMIPIRDSLRRSGMPHVVHALIAVNFLVFLFQISLADEESILLTYKYGLVPLRYSDPLWALKQGLSSTDYLPFLTGVFMHGGALHIVLNMWTLYIFGASLESRMGHGAFLLFYLLCGVAASYVHMAFNIQSDVPAIGASGAIAGVIGAYAVAFPHARLLLIVPLFFVPLFYEVPALAFAVFWYGIQIAQGAMALAKPSLGGGVAWWAHVGGFMAGMGLAPFFPARRLESRSLRRRSREEVEGRTQKDVREP
jgi:membrane associated rhomboid family serine protease